MSRSLTQQPKRESAPTSIPRGKGKRYTKEVLRLYETCKEVAKFSARKYRLQLLSTSLSYEDLPGTILQCVLGRSSAKKVLALPSLHQKHYVEMVASSLFRRRRQDALNVGHLCEVNKDWAAERMVEYGYTKAMQLRELLNAIESHSLSSESQLRRSVCSYLLKRLRGEGALTPPLPGEIATTAKIGSHSYNQTVGHEIVEITRWIRKTYADK